MSAEDLPTEIWSMIFEFLTVAEAFHTFNDLNKRFHSLIISHSERYHTDLQSIFNSKLNYFYEHYSHLIKSLSIFNNNDDPQPIDGLLPYNFNLDRFIWLQSLSLNNIESTDILHQLITQLSHLQELTSLTINNFILPSNRDTTLSLMNGIWRLPKLSYFHLDLIDKYRYYFPIVETISLSLERVELPTFCFGHRHLLHLFEHTPRLKCLSVHLSDYNFDQTLKYIFEHMSSLHISYRGSWDNLTKFLRMMPHLRQLTVQTKFQMTIDGHKWEQFISDHIPDLRDLRFVIEYFIFENVGVKHQVTWLIDSFCSLFWLNKHNWCVRCDWQQYSQQSVVYLYTLPYMLKNLYDHVPDLDIRSRTTCAHDIDHHVFNRVNWLDYDDFPINNSNVLPFRFPNIRHLSLILPLDNRFPLIISNLNQLNSLQLRIDNDDIHIQLQSLLDAAVKLRTLILIKWPLSTLIKLLEQIKSKSVRRIDLSGFSPTSIPQYFAREQCNILIRSPLFLQCEVLFIAVEYKQSIIDLVDNMNNLRILVVKCAHDSFEGSSASPPLNDDCLEWLRTHLPSMCIVSREPRPFGRIRIWIQ